MPNRKIKVTIIGKYQFYSNAKNKEYFFVSWTEPRMDPAEGSVGYLGTVDVETWNGLKVGNTVTAYTVHNGSYHQLMPL